MPRLLASPSLGWSPLWAHLGSGDLGVCLGDDGGAQLSLRASKWNTGRFRFKAISSNRSPIDYSRFFWVLIAFASVDFCKIIIYYQDTSNLNTTCKSLKEHLHNSAPATSYIAPYTSYLSLVHGVSILAIWLSAFSLSGWSIRSDFSCNFLFDLATIGGGSQ